MQEDGQVLHFNETLNGSLCVCVCVCVKTEIKYIYIYYINKEAVHELLVPA